MPLAQSPVYRQLDTKGRFARFGTEDAVPVLLSYNATWCAAHALGFSDSYAYVTLLATAVGMYFLRVRFADGLFGVLRYATTPKHFSPLAPDLVHHPYPGAARRLPRP